MKGFIVLLLIFVLFLIGCSPNDLSSRKIHNRDLGGIWCSNDELNFCYHIIVYKTGEISVSTFPKDEIYEIDGDISIPVVNKFFPADLKFINGKNKLFINVGFQIDTAILKMENNTLFIGDIEYEEFEF